SQPVTPRQKARRPKGRRASVVSDPLERDVVFGQLGGGPRRFRLPDRSHDLAPLPVLLRPLDPRADGDRVELLALQRRELVVRRPRRVDLRPTGTGRRGFGSGQLLLLPLAPGLRLRTEELDRVGDDRDRLALAGAVFGLPLAPVEAAIDRHRAALGEVGRAVLALRPPDGDVEVVGLIDPFPRPTVFAAAVDRNPLVPNRGAVHRWGPVWVPN